MNVSIEMLVQIITALASAGGVLWKLSDRLKTIEMEQQASAARLEQAVGQINAALTAHIARSEERHLAIRGQLEEHASELKRNRDAHASMRQVLDDHGRQLARLDARGS